MDGQIGKARAGGAGTSTSTRSFVECSKFSCETVLNQATFQRDVARLHALGPRALAELLIVSVVMVLLAGTLATLSMAVQLSNEQQQGTGLAMQHGRVALERIQRALSEATANEQFPGCVVFSEALGGWQYPDTLVVWHPQATATDSNGIENLNSR